MDAHNKLDELKALLEEKGIDLTDADDETGQPSTRIADAAVKELMLAGDSGSVWGSWSRGVKQVSGECTESTET